MIQTLLPILAADSPPPAANPMGPGGMLMPLMLMFVIFYFLMIRPQRKRQQEQDQMQKALSEGDRVVTAGGIHGVVSSVRENSVVVRIAENVKVEFDKVAVVRTIKKDKEENGAAAKS